MEDSEEPLLQVAFAPSIKAREIKTLAHLGAKVAESNLASTRQYA
jgi:hypothetical protein